MNKFDERLEYDTLPNNSLVKNMYNIFANGKNLTTKNYVKPKMDENNHLDMSLMGNGEDLRLMWKSLYESGSITITNIYKLLSKCNKTTKKIFLLILIKIVQESNFGNLTKCYLEGNLNELIERKMYANIDSARRAFKSALSLLTSVKVGYSLNSGKNNFIIGEQVLFTGWEIKKNNFQVDLSNKITDWRFLLQFLTIIPRYFGELSSNALDLLMYISCLIRQRRQLSDISSKGYFNISMRQLQIEMNLPNENKTKNPQRDIIVPVLEAIREINEIDQKYGSRSLALQPVYQSGTVIDFLKGYLKVTPLGNYKAYFIDLKNSIEHKKKIAQDRQARKEEIKIAAQAMAIAKRKKEDANAEDPLPSDDNRTGDGNNKTQD